VSVASDCEIIEGLVQQLQPYMKSVNVGYTGERNELGMAHGKGTQVYMLMAVDMKENLKMLSDTVGALIYGLMAIAMKATM
jgi:hypothetical protein